MRSLAVVSGSTPGAVARTTGRVAGYLACLASLGSVDLVVIHDAAATAASRRAWVHATLTGDAPPARVIEVAATPLLPPSGFIREVHLKHSDAPERSARQSAWFRVVDSFVGSAPEPYDATWCADVASLTRVGWIRRPLPALLDIDRSEDLETERTRRAVRRKAAGAHLVTMDSAPRHELLGLPGSIVAAPTDPSLRDAVVGAVELAGAYRPARTS